MSDITIKLLGKEKLIAKFQRKGVLLGDVQRAVALSAEQVRGEAVRTLQQGPPRSGRHYSRQKGRKVHVASAPGEPLKSDTGHLASHIFIRMQKRGETAEIGTSVPYGKFWEIDVDDKNKRPWLAPAFVKHSEAIKRRIENAVKRAMRG